MAGLCLLMSVYVTEAWSLVLSSEGRLMEELGHT